MAQPDLLLVMASGEPLGGPESEVTKLSGLREADR